VPHVIADSGVWYALFDPKDSNASEMTAEKTQPLEMHRVVMPWPILYKTLRTRFVRKTDSLRRLAAYLKRPNVILLDDTPFASAALDLSLQSSLQGRPLSMVDCAIRLMLDDVNTRIDYLMTFNVRDFSDVCRSRRIRLI
jgi:predicted nucleic acid-binding protein